METKRTPDQCFEDLENFPYEPNYLTVADGDGGSLRIHYVDTGPQDGKVVLLMHGQPAWSYLYRYMIPPLVAAGFRVIAPDLVGFGRSDKPMEKQDYTYARHIAWMSDWLVQLNIKNITVFFQDWGSLIGLRLVAAFPERFSHVVLANGGLPAGMIPAAFTAPLKAAYQNLAVPEAGELEDRFRDTSGIPGFLYWRKFAAENQDIAKPGTHIINGLMGKPLSKKEVDAYNAPYPDLSYAAGARQFPSLVPIFDDEAEVVENKAAWKILEQFQKPFLLAFSDNDPVTKGGDAAFRERVPGCKGIEHRTIGPAGHFLQQDQPEQCVQAILDVMANS
ncbi:haloalkane dehalogenase [Flavobacteriaceae bacterium]|nr:haloalkane dehalogenase [Flavobacteriaceae bacterium]